MSKYSPKQLFLEFSNNYCDTSYAWGKRGLFWGKGAAYDIDGITKLLKLLPYPCFGVYQGQVSNSPNEIYKNKFKGFVNSGKFKIALPYKFLQILDPDAFKEIQQDPYASVAHAIRNAADVTRACKIFWDTRSKDINNALYTWESRGATEPIIHYAGNSLAKALFFTGVNFIKLSESRFRAHSCGHLECMPALLTANYSCECPELATCPPTPKSCTIPTPCQKLSCANKASCAGEIFPSSGDFRYPESIAYFEAGRNSTIYSENFNNLSEYQKESILTQTSLLHAGYFLRKSYGGYGNFISNGDFFGTQDDTAFIKYAIGQNGMEYTTAFYDIDISKNSVYKTKLVRGITKLKPKLNRIKNTSLLTTPQQVKDCLYNGYGVVISTNVGFSDKRDEIGISYPDRLWYHTMAIIGYDDTRTIHPECLFLFANSWGNWNYGGHPPWGPIPDGSFLVTESHLQCMMNSFPRVDQFKDCNPLILKKCLPYFFDDGYVDFFSPPFSLTQLFANDFKDRADSRSQGRRWVRFACNGTKVIHVSEKLCNQRMLDELRTSSNCGDTCITMTNCDYIGCGTNQSPWGMTFAISFDEDIPFFRKEMKYEQFYLYTSKDTGTTLSCITSLYNATIKFQACHYCDFAEYDVIMGGVNIGSINLNSSLAESDTPCTDFGYVLTEAPPIVLTQQMVDQMRITYADNSCKVSLLLSCKLSQCHPSLSDVTIIDANGNTLVPLYNIGDTELELTFFAK